MSKRGSGGASGSWAEPYFACRMRCKRGFEYTQSILCPPHDSLKAVFAISQVILLTKTH
jgi:hypothetical protein